MYIPRLQTQKVQVILTMKIFIALLLCLIFMLPLAFAINAPKPLDEGNYYFKAMWCGPCVEQSKIVAQLEEQGFEFTIYDADADPDIFKNLNIKAIPMIIIVKSKNVVLKLKGKQPIRKLIRLLIKDQETDD